MEKTPIKDLLQQADYNEDIQVIPVDKLSSNNILLWRCVMNHLKKESKEEELDMLMPELVRFCMYIVEYMEFLEAKTRDTEALWENKNEEFILYQLFEMTNLYDLTDEVGRNELKKLSLKTLSCPLQSERIVKCVINQLCNVEPIVESRVSLLIEVINELRMPMEQPPTPQLAAPVTLSEKEKHDLKMKVKSGDLQTISLVDILCFAASANQGEDLRSGGGPVQGDARKKIQGRFNFAIRNQQVEGRVGRIS